MKTINVFLSIAGFIALLPASSYADAQISPSLLFRRSAPLTSVNRIAQPTDTAHAMVTLRFVEPPSAEVLNEIERHGVSFSRYEGEILHTQTIYPASIELDSLESVAAFSDIVTIEDSAHIYSESTLDVSNPLVQATEVWSLHHNTLPVDGENVRIVNVDTGIDIYHPAFFKADGGEYDWIDVNDNGTFDRGIDAVDLNNSGDMDPGETLSFYDATFIDSNDIMFNAVTFGVYDAGYDWLFNDANNSGSREYGPVHGYTETSPSYGEMLFICDDENQNNRLDPGERLTGLGTSKIAAIYAVEGVFIRGENLLSAPSENHNHGTPAAGILVGQWPGRQFTGMAPGAEIVSINRLNMPSTSSIEEGIIWAVEYMDAKIVQHEFGSWVGEFLDGTSNYEIMIDEQVDEGIHHITASGNLAGPTRMKHAAFTIPKHSSNTLAFNVPIEPYNYNIQQVSMSIIWQSTYDIIRPKITLKLSDGRSHILTASTDPYLIGDYYCQSALVSHQLSNTRRFDIVLFVTNSTPYVSGDFELDFEYSSTLPYSPDSLTIDAFISDDKTGWMNGAHFSNYVTDDGTVTAPGTSISGITVGAYSPREFRSRTVTGDISDFSGWGRTIDGRIAVNITAPGYTIFSPSSHTYVGGEPGGYVDFGGTSAALPFVTGCAALILQAAPEITPLELAQVLYDGALIDEFVGSEVPNDTWGYGKLHIYDAIINADIITSAGIADNVPSTFTLSPPYPNPFNAATQIDINISDTDNSSFECCIFNLLGQTVRHINSINTQGNRATILWDGCDDTGSTVSTGIYLISVTSGKYSQVSRVVFLK